MDMNDKDYITGKCPPGYGHFRDTPGSPTSSETGESKKELIERWFLIPLRKMEEHDAFICLMACFPLWEKFLRAMKEIKANENFSEGRPVFKYLGKKWGVDEKTAFAVWRNFRNGLLHRAMVKVDSEREFFITDGKDHDGIIKVDGNSVIINPWKLRDQIVTIIGNNKQIWDDHEFSLMKVYRKI
jgi:hypothetical protein